MNILATVPRSGTRYVKEILSRQGIEFKQQHLDQLPRPLSQRDRYVLTVRDPLLSWMYWGWQQGKPLDQFVEMLDLHCLIEDSAPRVYTWDLREDTNRQGKELAEFFEVEPAYEYRQKNKWISKKGSGKPTSLEDFMAAPITNRDQVIEACRPFRERYDFPNL